MNTTAKIRRFFVAPEIRSALRACKTVERDRDREKEVCRELRSAVGIHFSFTPKEALRLSAGVADRFRLDVCDALLNTHGTEAIRGAWQNGYWCDIVAAYCNAGDSYASTVIQARTDGGGSRFFVGCVGDFVERNEKRLGIL